MARKNLLFDYLAGALTMEQLREQIASSADPASREWLQLAEFDRRCRRILSRLKPRPGAAERLEELVSRAALENDSPGEHLDIGNSWPMSGTAMQFDVVGAQKITKKKRHVRRKRRNGKGPDGRSRLGH